MKSAHQSPWKSANPSTPCFPNSKGTLLTSLVSFDRGTGGNTQPELFSPHPIFWLSLSWLKSTRSQRARKTVDTTHRCQLLRAQNRMENGKDWIWRSNRHFWHNIKHNKQVSYTMLEGNRTENMDCEYRGRKRGNIEVLSRVFRVSFIKKVTFEQRLERREYMSPLYLEEQ